MDRFQFFEFVPRAVFREACQKWMERLSQKMPVDSTFRASVTKVKNGYFFSFNAQGAMGDFDCEIFLDETNADRSRRDWQAVALVHLEKAVYRKLHKWMSVRDIGAAHSVQGFADHDEYETTVTRKAS